MQSLQCGVTAKMCVTAMMCVTAVICLFNGYNVERLWWNLVIEKYTANTRFCMICNYVNKITPALQSRCTRYVTAIL
jgi:hypothetical protein